MQTRKLTQLLLMVTALLAVSWQSATGKPLVVATTTDLADFARIAGGDRVSVVSICDEGENPHFPNLTPSDKRNVAKARLFLQIGLSLEIWADRLIADSHNRNLVIQTCTKKLDVLEKPRGRIDPGMGDIHPEGNPHVSLNPTNAKIMMSNVLGGLLAVAPNDTDHFKSNVRQWFAQIDTKIAAWQAKLDPWKGKPVVEYHSSFVYMADKFGFKIANRVEPRPGIPPGPQHIRALVGQMKNDNINVLITEPWWAEDTAKSVARQTGAQLVELAAYPGALPNTSTYTRMMDYNVNTLVAALGGG